MVSFFAKNMIAMFPAFVCRYFYGQTPKGEDTPGEGFFQVDYIREPMTRQKKAVLPCKYDWDTKKLIRVSELEAKKLEDANKSAWDREEE